MTDLERFLSKYAMPHYIEYHVRDRKSWEFYRECCTPGPRWSDERINEAAKKFDNRDKESVNKGMGHLIEKEIMTKVPPLLAKGRYFPNLEHVLQPMATFENLCKFMTLLHEVTGNPEGEFPRIRPES